MGEERRLACEYVDLIYAFLKLGFSDPQENEAKNTEEKIMRVEAMLDRFIEHDKRVSELLQLYQEISFFRRKAFKEVIEHMVSIKALCDQELKPEMRKLFLKESETRLAQAQQICEKLSLLINQAKQPENNKTVLELIEYLENNHRVMEERLQVAVELLNMAREELEKLKPGITD